MEALAGTVLLVVWLAGCLVAVYLKPEYENIEKQLRKR